MKKLSYIYLLAFIWLLGCKSGTNNESGSLTKIEDKENKVQVISSCISEYRYIPLKTDKKTFIGSNIGKIRNVSGYYYVSCDYKRIRKFDSTGAYLMEINRIGSGPQEYTFLADYDVSPSVIAILDVNKILLYHPETGTHIKTIPLDCMGSAIKIVNDNLFAVYTSGEDVLLKIVDSNGKEVNNSGKRVSLSRLSRRNPFMMLDDHTFFIQQGYSNDLITYNASKNAFYNTKLLDNNGFISMEKENDFIRSNGGGYYNDINNDLISSISSSGSDILFIAKYNGNLRCFIADKATGKVKYSFDDTIMNDLTFTDPNIWGYTSVCFSENSFISYLTLDEVKEGLQTHSQQNNSKNYQTLQELVTLANDDIDLLLIEFKFKPMIPSQQM